MTRQELIDRTRQLIEEGDRLVASPSLARLRLWLKLSDDLLSAAWGTMDRYHLAWLMVGRPADAVRGRPMTPDEEAAYVRDVARAKTAALRMSLEAVERFGMPFLGEDGGSVRGAGGSDPVREAAGSDPARGAAGSDPARGADGSPREAGAPDPARGRPPTSDPR